MKSISVFEHSAIEALSETEKSALERLNATAGRDLFEVDRHTAWATSHVGVVQLGTRAIQVLPKMHRETSNPEECQREATCNLLFLLSYTSKLAVTETEIARLVRQEAPLSEVLFWIFARRLWDAVRREVLRGYVAVEARTNVLKGRWQVSKQAQRSDGWRRDRFDVAYDEFTEDNLPNRLLKATVERLTQMADWSETHRQLARLRAAFADVADVTPRSEDFTEAAQWMLRHRRCAGEGHHYRPLLDMARMFWLGAGPQLAPGRLDTFAFMFDMNELFEEFIAEFIRRELRSEWHGRGWSLRPQSGTRHLLCDNSGAMFCRLVPDIRFETRGVETPLIVDTKYKPLDTTAEAGIASTDAYQMFAYKERYRCPRVILLYPQISEIIVRDFKTESEQWLEVRTVDLRRELMREKTRLREELAALLVPAPKVEIGD